MASRIPSRYLALVLAPAGRDAVVAQALLKEAGIDMARCVDLADFQQALNDDICMTVVTEEALRSSDLRGIAAHVAGQPPWSDLPFIVLTQRGGGPERNPAAGRLAEILGNVTFLERPFHPTTFVSVARTALKGRQRQYDARAWIEELHEGEERLQTALAAGRLGSWELDMETGVLTTSPACKAVFGRAPEASFTYAELVASIHSDDRPAMEAAVRVTVETGSDYAIEYRSIWPDGSVHWAEIHARLVKDIGTRRSRMVGVSADITERKVGEDRLRRLNETLEERVAERTAELKQAHDAVLAQVDQRECAEEQLRQAQKMEMIGQLTGGVAHDFNNLLMAVLGNLDLLRPRVAADPDAARLIDIASQGAQRGAALTQRLLAFARRQDLQVQPRDMVALVSGMRDLLARSVGSRIELRLDLPSRIAPALMDANQVELALLNLAVNARDAMPDGGPVTIRVDRAEMPPGRDLEPGSYIRLIVRDGGHGMDAATLKKATDPFFTTKEVGKGTGLGLSMIHGLAIQLKGTLRLYSEVGRGTSAELWLPVADGACEAAEEAVPAPAMARPSTPVTPRTILVVDDDVLISMTTVMMIGDLGHRVLEANSGAKALQILGSDEVIDLLVTDYSMPRMTGAELAKSARKLRPGLPILLATGYAELPPGAGIDLPRLAKPYQQEQLRVELAKLLGP
ncbi:ATP-binding protein [Roseococcus sp.]|uniref:ATP-binding protein n=1 Tax=Roseococcus sp. TaxID=2109646 RepID=UPI003BAAF340